MTVDQQSEIAQLRLELAQAIHEYAVLQVPRPTLSDPQFDAKMARLRALELEHDDCPLDSPSQRVGGLSLNSFEKVAHKVPMLSLDNTFSADEVLNFFVSKTRNYPQVVPLLVVEPKIDGLSLSLHYEKGLLVRALTRGDGTHGEDVTANARTISSIPLRLKAPDTCEVRGEVYISKADFAVLNVDDEFSNARNTAAGSLKLKDPREVAQRRLSFIAYGLMPGLPSHTRTIGRLSENFTVPSYTTATWTQGEDVIAQSIFTMAERRDDLPYDTDGLVFKINNTQDQVHLGLNNRSPNWATSYKFPPVEKVTKLLGITVQVGRLGTLTPVAELEPVNLGGAVITRATLHNQSEIERLGINIGDRVNVARMGEVIPGIVSVAEKLTVGHWKFPAVCPCCGVEVKTSDKFVAITCPNVDGCRDQIQARLEHATKKQSLDWDGCGEQTIRLLIEHGCFRLSHLMTITDVSFLGVAASKRFLKGRDVVKAAPMWRKIHALGIDGVGITSSKELSRRWTSLADMLDAPFAELVGVLGPVAAKAFKTFMDSNIDELVRLSTSGFEFADTRKSGPLTGKCFCITGTLLSGGRDQVEKRIEDAGGSCKSSCSKAVHYLIVGDGAGQSKTESAKKYGTACITEADLYAMLGIPIPIMDDITID